MTARVDNKFTFGDIDVKAHVAANIHHYLDVFCDCLLRAAKGDVVHVS